MKKTILILSFVVYISSLAVAQPVRVGAEVFVEKNLDSVRGKKLGIVCNQTSVFPNGTHLVDSLRRLGLEVTALFSPEHGIRGQAAAGVQIGNQIDSGTGLTVYSLYGKTLKPTAEMVRNVDVFIFDLQDAGSRFFTFSSTMANVMEAARDFGKKIYVLDRPNPINGVDLEGPVLDMTLISFFGLFPIPVRHGLTMGELANMIVGEGWLNYNSSVDLTVVPMEGWRRSMWYDSTGLPWIPPSPNMKTLATATVYPGTCFFEATNISEGRGTPKPFEYIGAPNLNSEKAVSLLSRLHLPGARFSPVIFTPRADSVAAPDPKFKDKQCRGVSVRVVDRKKYRPVLTGLMMLSILHDLYPRKIQVLQGRLDRLTGDTNIGERLMRGKVEKEILEPFKSQLDEFKERRAKYLLYKE